MTSINRLFKQRVIQFPNKYQKLKCQALKGRNMSAMGNAHRKERASPNNRGEWQ